MTTHAHAANQPVGGKYDRKNRTDVSGSSSSAIGHHFGHFGHFAPMVHTAPIHGLTTAHQKISCPACSAGILWNGAPVAFLCAGCGGTIDGATLTLG
jgi:hypothetical protein